jgi:hypothetical protein
MTIGSLLTPKPARPKGDSGLLGAVAAPLEEWRGVPGAWEPIVENSQGEISREGKFTRPPLFMTKHRNKSRRVRPGDSRARDPPRANIAPFSA